MHFRGKGYRPILLLGGATGLIGDPSGRSSERNLLSEAQIRHNVASFETQFSSLIERLGDSYAKHTDSRYQNLPPFYLQNNIEFYSGMSSIAFLRDVGKHFRVNTMLSRDSVKSRMASPDDTSSEGISFTEFSYQVL